MTHRKFDPACECITCVARRKFAVQQGRETVDNKYFFILWQPESEAVEAAERMAQKHGVEFYVMKAMARSAPVKVVTTTLGQ